VSLSPGAFTTPAGEVWQGVLCEQGHRVIVCTHDTHNETDADQCARRALAQLRLRGTLPDGWVRY
jgi:hypothetical protein